MLPPIISTTPNSPTVCATVSTSEETIPGHASGSSTRLNALQRDRPLTQAASRTSCGIASKARCIGCTAKGRLNTIEASSNPSKLNASGRPATDWYAWPSQDAPPNAVRR